MAKKAYVWDGLNWVEIASTIPSISSILPSQINNSGKFLTTNGSTVSWGTVDLTPYATISNPSFTGTPTAPTATIDTNTSQIATTAYVVGQGYAKLSSPTFTGTVVLPSSTYIGDVSATEIGYLDGVTSAIQTQLNTKITSATIDNKELLAIAGAL